MQLELFNNVELENKLINYETQLESIIWFCNHLKQTTINYTKEEIAEYILNQIIDYQ